MRTEPGIFMEPGLLNRKTIEQYERVIVDHKVSNDESITLDINYDFGDFRMSFQDIFNARKNKIRFLVNKDKWVDTMSSAFSWMDGIEDEPNLKDNALTVGRTEYMRFLAMHDRLEKHFSSTRTKSWFEDLEMLKPPGRRPSISAMKGNSAGTKKTASAGYGSSTRMVFQGCSAMTWASEKRIRSWRS